MTAAQLAGVGGTITIVAAVLFVSAWLLSLVPGSPSPGGVDLARWLSVPAHIALLLGLGAIYGVQASETGIWGLVGFLMAFSGVAIFIGYVIGGWATAIPEPKLGPVGGGLWLVGLLTLAIVTWGAGVLPAGAAVFWMSGALVYAMTVPDGPDDPPRLTVVIGAAVFALGIGWAGVAILNL